MLKINLDNKLHLWRIVDSESGHEELSGDVQTDAPCRLVLNPKGAGGWLEVEGTATRDGSVVVIR